VTIVGEKQSIGNTLNKIYTFWPHLARMMDLELIPIWKNTNT